MGRGGDGALSATFTPRVEVIHGKCETAMAAMEPDSIDAIVTDPPYGIGFMGREWDRDFIDRRVASKARKKTGVPAGHGRIENGGFVEYDRTLTGNRAFQVWCEGWAHEALRVLKPGGHMTVFGGTRTYHRMISGVEDAGFEIRDCLMFMYGVGFPKSHNLHGDWEGWGTALKPAWEPIILARKPLSERNVAANVQRWGVGALNIDGCRLGGSWERSTPTKGDIRGGRYGASAGATIDCPPQASPDGGRWPANVALDEEAAAMLDDATGDRPSGSAHVLRRGATTGAGMGYGSSAAGDVLNATYGDSGGASRFFYTAKADKADRGRGNDHPTVKPVDLMRWLCRLVTPAGGTILDPFTGSGSTLVAAAMEGFDAIGIDSDAHYCDIARRRAYAAAQPRLALTGGDPR